mmetsp:Transcript_70194/g.131238  ORF Transcript_70194/g.131238 Transcript_70194/m.131238 type:complete len:183 (-) Transcript_70194:177-725(-)
MPPHNPHGDWAVDLCPDSFCGNLPFCLLAWCCPCIAVYQLSEEARPWEVCGMDINDTGGSTMLAVIFLVLFCIGMAVPGLLTTALLFFAVFMVAQGAAERFGVDEDFIPMCCKAWWCIPCYLTQMYETASEAPPLQQQGYGPGYPQQHHGGGGHHKPAREIYLLKVEKDDVEAGVPADCGNY